MPQLSIKMMQMEITDTTLKFDINNVYQKIFRRNVRGDEELVQITFDDTV